MSAPLESKPWVVLLLEDKGPGEYFRFQVRGLNLWDGGKKFCWSIPGPEVSGQWSNYDWSAVGGDPSK